MSKYSVSNMEYTVNKVEVNKPKLVGLELMGFIQNSIDSEIFVEDVSTLDLSDYVVKFQKENRTTYEGYLEMSESLTGIVNFKTLSRDEWERD